MSTVPAQREFDWTIRRAEWEPRRRPRPPFGPTAVEIVRSCGLRLCFEASPGYEPRLTFAARIGTAFHRTLESLATADRAPGVALASGVRDRFEAELRTQVAEAASRPRERRLPKSEARQAAAIDALLQAAHRIARAEPARPEVGAPAKDASGSVEVEVPVASSDGLFRGVVDRAEHSASGVRLLDFKSALRDDLPERYERQLQLYARMWRDTRGAWPVAADVVYPLAGTIHPVRVDPGACESVAAESAALVREVTTARRAADLARPGQVCQVCAFRPWCEPFWETQAPLESRVAPERGEVGLEGPIERLERGERAIRVVIRWGAARVELVVPPDRFPQLARAAPGDRVRLLDAELRGLRHQPRARVTEFTELYLVDPGGAPG